MVVAFSKVRPGPDRNASKRVLSPPLRQFGASAIILRSPTLWQRQDTLYALGPMRRDYCRTPFPRAWYRDQANFLLYWVPNNRSPSRPLGSYFLVSLPGKIHLITVKA